MHSTPSTFRTRIAAVRPGTDGQRASKAELRITYHNYLGLNRTATVVSRLGLRTVIPFEGFDHSEAATRSNKKDGNPNRPCFIIRVHYGARGDVFLDNSDLYNDLGKSPSMEAKATMDAIEQFNAPGTRHSHQTCTVEYVIPVDDFDRNGGTLYLQNLDLQISLLGSKKVPPHPYSYLGQRDRDAYSFGVNMTPQGFFYGIYIRDRDGQYGQRYVNIEGEVYAVRVIEDLTGTELDGVYAVTSNRTGGNHHTDRTAVEYYTFEEADSKLGLYSSYNEARAFGNIQERAKREHEERTNELRMREQCLRAERMEIDHQNALNASRIDYLKELNRVKMMEYDRAMKNLEYKRKLVDEQLTRREQFFKRESQIAKELADSRSGKQKEFMEVVKLVPTIFTACVTLGQLYVKIKTGK